MITSPLPSKSLITPPKSKSEKRFSYSPISTSPSPSKSRERSPLMTSKSQPKKRLCYKSLKFPQNKGEKCKSAFEVWLFNSNFYCMILGISNSSGKAKGKEELQRCRHIFVVAFSSYLYRLFIFSILLFRTNSMVWTSFREQSNERYLFNIKRK